MDIEYRGKERLRLTLGDIDVGTVFSAVIGPYRGVFLRTGSGIVSLESPSHDWDYEDLTVEDYRPLKAKLIIEGEA